MNEKKMSEKKMNETNINEIYEQLNHENNANSKNETKEKDKRVKTLKNTIFLFTILFIIILNMMVLASCTKKDNKEINGISEEVITRKEEKTNESDDNKNQNYTDNQNINGGEDINKGNGINKELLEEITCEIKGEVMHPGVYTLKKGSRVIDLVKISGGFKKDSRSDLINQARKLRDGEVITVYDKYNTSINLERDINNGGTNNSNNSDDNDLGDSKNKLVININTATQAELESIPGIGKVTANNIIEYRKEHGNFRSIEDIKNVDRIGEKTFLKIKKYIKI